MKRHIALVAPGAIPPLTEGRKRMVTDLVGVLRARGMAVDVLDGGPSAPPPMMILRAMRNLARQCARSTPPDAVAVFPFGTFRGARAWANAWLLRRTRSICARAGIPVLPVFYSCVGLELDELSSRFGPALAVGRETDGLQLIHLGVDRKLESWRPTQAGLKRLLFLCGYQSSGRRAWNDVLHERGLIDLLLAGNALADGGMRLTVAVPFLRHARMRERLRDAAARFCPRLEIESRTEVDPIHCFAAHDAFVFPYRPEHAVFIPTSLLEALSVGIPTIAADHTMYRALTVAAGQCRCTLHRIADAGDLAEKILTTQRDYAAAVARAESVSLEIRREWNLARCADEFLAAFDALR